MNQIQVTKNMEMKMSQSNYFIRMYKKQQEQILKELEPYFLNSNPEIERALNKQYDELEEEITRFQSIKKLSFNSIKKLRAESRKINKKQITL